MPTPLRRTAPLALIASALLALTACAAPAASTPASTAAGATTLTIEHAQGSTEVPVNPQKVVVMDLASLETIAAVGGEATVVGVPDTNFPDHIAAYRDVTKVGTLFEPDYEAIAGLAPDLIVVAARSAATLPEMAKIAPTIDLTGDNANFVEAARLRAGQLGEIYSATETVDALFAGIDASVAEVKELAPQAGTALVAMVSGGEISAFGPGSRFGWLFSDLGLVPVLDDVEAATHGDPISSEFLLEHNPDWLFVIDRDAAVGTEGGAAASEVLDNEIVRKTTFWEAGQLVHLDPVGLYIVMNGPVSVQNTIVQIKAGLQGGTGS